MAEDEMYYIYHIPGKKIGVTSNLWNRVTVQQGYKPSEYEILEESSDIDYVSFRELELQRDYGYKVDIKLYKNLKPNKQTMNINATEQTSTFPCAVKDLKRLLNRNIGATWHTDHGVFTVNDDSIEWIMRHAKTSMFNPERCYVYNKAFSAFWNYQVDTISNKIASKDYFKETLGGSIECDCSETCTPRASDLRFELIREWAHNRGIYASGDTKTQFAKLMEESGELARAILKSDKEEFTDAIGDMVVVLTNLAELGGTDIETCIDDAYAVIAKRTGKMSNGTFVKD
jgi:NTP pyrophosphatase (non-canonical NTP hydrolase)